MKVGDKVRVVSGLGRSRRKGRVSFEPNNIGREGRIGATDMDGSVYVRFDDDGRSDWGQPDELELVAAPAPAFAPGDRVEFKDVDRRSGTGVLLRVAPCGEWIVKLDDGFDFGWEANTRGFNAPGLCWYAPARKLVKLPPAAEAPPDTLETKAATKHSKPRMGLLFGFGDALLAIAHILTLGAKKYADDSWKREPFTEKDYFDAIGRHLAKIGAGQERDPEWNTLHAAHLATDAGMYLWHVLKRVGTPADLGQ